MKVVTFLIHLVCCFFFIIPGAKAQNKVLKLKLPKELPTIESPKKLQNFESIDEMKYFLGNDVQPYLESGLQVTTAEGDVYLFYPYTASSHLGFHTEVIDGQNYLVRIRSARLEQINVGPIVGATFLLDLIPGQTKSTTSSTTTSATTTLSFSISASIELGFGETATILGIEIDASSSYTIAKTVSSTVTEGTSYSFAPSWVAAGYTHANIYASMNYDLFILTFDFVPQTNADACYSDCNADYRSCISGCVGDIDRTCRFACLDEVSACHDQCDNLVYYDWGNMITNTAEMKIPHAYTLVELSY